MQSICTSTLRMIRLAALSAFALLAESSLVWADETTIQWVRPGVFFPVLGWREPVSLENSDGADRLLAGLPPRRYNCHFYVKTHIECRGGTVLPHFLLRRPRIDQLTESYLEARGYRRAGDGQAQAGDVLVAGRPDGRGGFHLTHSAVVVKTDADGRMVAIRQKFNDRLPVVDVSPEEFTMLYAGLHPWETHLWRRPVPGWDTPGSAWAGR